MTTPVAQSTAQSTAQTTDKAIVQIKSAPPQHWVGNGFKVHGMFNYNDNAALFSPFLLMIKLLSKHRFMSSSKHTLIPLL